MRKLWSLIALVGGLANVALASDWSEGPCDGSPTPLPIGPDLSLEQMRDKVGGNTLALAPSVPIENGVTGFLCGWEVERERLCVVAFSQSEAETQTEAEGAYLALDLYLESSIFASLQTGVSQGVPVKRLLSEVPQSHPWRNGMRLADVTNDGCDDLVVSVQAENSQGNETLYLHMIPGSCAPASRTPTQLTGTPCPLEDADGIEASLTGATDACGGATLSIEVCSESASSAFDVVTLRTGSDESPQQHLVLPGKDTVCGKTNGWSGTLGVYPALTDLEGVSPTPVLWLEADKARLEEAQVRALRAQDEPGGLLIVGGGDSNGKSLLYVVPEQALEEALFSGKTSLDLLAECNTCAKSSEAVRGSVQDTRVVTRVVSTGECAGTPCTVSLFAAISDKNLTLGTWSTATPSLLPLTDISLNSIGQPSLSFTSEDMDGDGWPELWVAPVGMLPSYQTAGTAANPNAVGLLLSTMLIDKTTLRTDVTPAPGLRVYESHESAAPLLLASGHLQRESEELPFELIGFGEDSDSGIGGGKSSLHLWTGLERLFDRDEDGVIRSNVPLRVDRWTIESTLLPVLAAGDCDDNNSTVALGNDELCDTAVDEDCLGRGYLGCDKDGDGVGWCRDCDDATPDDTYLINGIQSCAAPSCSSVGRAINTPSFPGGALVVLLTLWRIRSRNRENNHGPSQ